MPASSEWTIETLKEYLLRVVSDAERRVDGQILAQKEAVAIAMNAADRAVSKAEVASEKRFESVNEFRSALSDNGRMQMPRLEAEGIFKAINDKFEAANGALSHRIDILAANATKNEGQSSGVHAGWGYAVGVVGLVSLLISLLWKFKP